MFVVVLGSGRSRNSKNNILTQTTAVHNICLKYFLKDFKHVINTLYAIIVIPISLANFSYIEINQRVNDLIFRFLSVLWSHLAPLSIKAPQVPCITSIYCLQKCTVRLVLKLLKV